MVCLKSIGRVSLAFALAFAAWAQSDTNQNSTTESKQEHKGDPGAAREIGAGAGATGVAKGAGDAAKGAGKAAGDLVTLHPVNAGVAAGKGAAGAGKDVTVGSAKGAGKVTKGIGRVFRKLF